MQGERERGWPMLFPKIWPVACSRPSPSFPKKRPSIQLHASLLNPREERRVKECRKWMKPWPKKGCVTGQLVQLENEGRKTETREEEEAEKHEQRRKKNLLNSFLIHLKQEEVRAASDVVAGTLLMNNLNMHVLFDPGATWHNQKIDVFSQV